MFYLVNAKMREMMPVNFTNIIARIHDYELIYDIYYKTFYRMSMVVF